MKVLETVYRGHRFRSRAEARWAVFFENLSIEYEYEPEGFDLGFGCLYLPDFYLPGLEVYFEVKGRSPSAEEFRKARLLSSATRTPVVVAWNQIGYVDNMRHRTRFTDHEMLAFLGCEDELWQSDLLDPALEHKFSDEPIGELLAQHFPHERLPGHEREQERRRRIVELYEAYYRNLGLRRYESIGRCNSAGWHLIEGRPRLLPWAETPDRRIARAYNAARGARFDSAGTRTAGASE